MKVAIASAVLAAGLATAAPLEKRQAINDAVILNYALTLEHLEATFYAEGLSMYDAAAFKAAGVDPSVRARIVEIGAQEKTHVAFLTTALSAAGATPVKACKYNFGLTGVKSFLATASVLEGVGVSAYLGAAASIADKEYLTAAGAILTVEARHTSFIRNTIGEDPFSQVFDVPLTFNEVYSLAAPFFASCPSSNPALPVKAFPALKASSVGKAGEMVKLTPADPKSIQGKSPIYAAFIGFPTNQYGLYDPVSMSVMVPVMSQGFGGQTAIVLTTSNSSVTDDNTLAGPALIEILA